MKKYTLDLQLFAAEANTTVAADLEPAISIDFVTRITKNIDELRQLLGITEMIPMPAGNTIKLYEMRQKNTPAQVGEGENIALTEFERVAVKTIDLVLKKYRHNTTAEAIQKIGRNKAINQTDEKHVSGIQKEIKQDFYAVLATGTGAVTGGATLQATLANTWGAIKKYHEDEDATPIYFVSSEDVAEYLGNAQVTTQTAFGMDYIQSFLGLGTVVIVPSLAKGTVIGTAKENLNGVYIPANSGDVATTFGLTSDSTGLIGMTHQPITSNATIDTLLMSGVVFFPERLDGVFKGTIAGA